MKTVKNNIIKSLRITVALMVLCGIIYPFALNGITNVLFPHQASGNLIVVDGQALGSKYVGQEFTKDYFMWSRPSAVHYNVYKNNDGEEVYNDGSKFEGVSSGSENYANSNPEMKKRVDEYLKYFLKKNPTVSIKDIPTDLVTSSGSGLDPNISVKAAEIQIPRIAKASGLSEDTIKKIVAENTETKFLNVFGTENVNVLGVNIDIAKEMGLLKK